MTLQAVLDQARVNSQQFRIGAARVGPRRRGRKQATRGAAAVAQRLQPVHLHAAQRHAVRRLGAERRPAHLRDVAERARRRLLAGEVVGVPRRGRGRSGGARQGRRRRPRPRRRRSCRTTTALVAAQRKLASAQQSLREAQQFLDITQKQESGGEVAHSDVVKAQIQVAQRLRDAQDAELAVAQEPARTVGAGLPRLPRHLLGRRRSADAGAAAAADRSQGHGRRQQPGPARRRSVGPAGNVRRRRRARRRAAVGVVRLFLRHQRERVRHLRSRRPSAARLGRAGAAERAAVELGRGAEQAETGAAARSGGARATSRSRSASCRPTSAPFIARRKSRAIRSHRCANRSTSRPKACA